MMYAGLFRRGIGQGIPTIFPIDCALTPLSTGLNRYSSQLNFENGGTKVVRSFEGYKSYTMEFKGDDVDLRSANLDNILALYNGGLNMGNGNAFFIYDGANDGRNILPPEWRSYYSFDPRYSRRTLFPGANYTQIQSTDLHYYRLLANDNPNYTDTSVSTYILVPPGKALHVDINLFPAGGLSTVEIASIDNTTGNTWDNLVTPAASVQGRIPLPAARQSTGDIFRIRAKRDTTPGSHFEIRTAFATLKDDSEAFTSPPESEIGFRSPVVLHGAGGFQFSAETVPYTYTSVVTGLRSYSIDIVETQTWL